MTRHYLDLDYAMQQMPEQSAIYQPTSFWAEASAVLAEEFRDRGIEQFRNGPKALSFFVPTYGVPGNGLSAELMSQIGALVEADSRQALGIRHCLDGELAALADYRVVKSACDEQIGMALHEFSESEFGAPREQFVFDDRRFSRSSLNYLLGLCMLQRHVDTQAFKCVLEIGGGFGTLGEILLKCAAEHTRYIDLDIPPVQFAAQSYLQAVFGDDQVTTLRELAGRDTIEIDGLARAATLGSWQIEQLQGEVDLFVNYISFQEMEPEVVANYLSHVDRLQSQWVLLRNMREGKQQRTATRVGVETPIESDAYLDMLPGYTLVERNVQPYGYRTVDGFHSEVLLLRRTAG